MVKAVCSTTLALFSANTSVMLEDLNWVSLQLHLVPNNLYIGQLGNGCILFRVEGFITDLEELSSEINVDVSVLDASNFNMCLCQQWQADIL